MTGANQNAQKLLSTDLVNTNMLYTCYKSVFTIFYVGKPVLSGQLDPSQGRPLNGGLTVSLSSQHSITLLVASYSSRRPEALAMVLSFSIYLLIMFLNPRIEAWLYRITNTSNPEFKSDLDALNGNRKTTNITSSYEKMVDEQNYGIQEKEKKFDGTENNQNAEKEKDEDKEDGKEQEEKNDKQKEETQPLNGKV